MNYEKLTQNAGSAVMNSQNIAVEQGHQQIEPEHLAAALLKQKEGLIPKLISGMGKDVKNIITEAVFQRGNSRREELSDS